VHLGQIDPFEAVASRAEVSFTPSPSLEDRVAEVWARTLEVPAEPGTRLLDVLFTYQGLERSQRLGLLIAELAAATGVHLPVTIAFDSPSAAELAMMIRADDKSRFDRPIKMQAGVGQPLFVLPGLGGIGLDALALVRHLRFAGPVYFNPPQGLDGAEPHQTLPEVVADHIAVIRAVQPRGPYWLLGYSWGGLVGLEIARCLREEGEDIAFIGMIDPVLNPVDWTYAAWLQFIGTRVRLHVKAMRQAQSLLATVRYGGHLVVPVIDKVVRLFGFNRLWPLAQNADILPPPLAAIWSTESEIIKSYRVQYFSDPVTIFATRSGHAAECNPEKVWPHKIGQLDLQWVPGDHGLSEASVRETAEAISEAIEAHRIKVEAVRASF
jgi:acetoacetyl-CoA synthetase